MPCYYPLQAIRSDTSFTSSGKRSIVFLGKKDVSHLKDDPDFLTLPCGQCIGCRLERSRQWAMRCLHESRLYEKNCFITLTFDDDHLFKRRNPMSLDVSEFQRFMKRLRKRFGKGIRFFHCGEYGELYARPHYHACLFNFDFDDRVLFKIVNSIPLYISESLSDLWPFGFSTVGNVTFDSAAYVARYLMKKVNGSKAFDHYNKVDEITGEILLTRKPEYVTMSRRPGIGKSWFDQYHSDVYVHGGDSVIMNNRQVRPPRYYDSQYEIINSSHLESIKIERKRKAALYAVDSMPQRLDARLKVQEARLSKLIRNVE